jgi:hypothetical protein
VSRFRRGSSTRETSRHHVHALLGSVVRHSKKGLLMSQLGQTRTFSAMLDQCPLDLPEADIKRSGSHVRLVPLPDSCSAANGSAHSIAVAIESSWGCPEARQPRLLD